MQSLPVEDINYDSLIVVHTIYTIKDPDTKKPGFLYHSFKMLDQSVRMYIDIDPRDWDFRVEK